jgi:hypothetical protein
VTLGAVFCRFGASSWLEVAEDAALDRLLIICYIEAIGGGIRVVARFGIISASAFLGVFTGFVSFAGFGFAMLGRLGGLPSIFLSLLAVGGQYSGSIGSFGSQ